MQYLLCARNLTPWWDRLVEWELLFYFIFSARFLSPLLLWVHPLYSSRHNPCLDIMVFLILRNTYEPAALIWGLPGILNKDLDLKVKNKPFYLWVHDARKMRLGLKWASPLPHIESTAIVVRNETSRVKLKWKVGEEENSGDFWVWIPGPHLWFGQVVQYLLSIYTRNHILYVS